MENEQYYAILRSVKVLKEVNESTSNFYLKKMEGFGAKINDELFRLSGGKSSKALKSYISYELSNLLKLSNETIAIEKELDKENPRKIIYESLAHSLDEIISQLTRDYSILTPQSASLIKKCNFQINIDKLWKDFSELLISRHKQDLLKIIEHKITAVKTSRATVNKIEYLEKAVQHLNSFFSSDAHLTADFNILIELTRLNFNSPEIYQYCCDIIQQEVKEEHITSEKHRKLIYLKKQIRQLFLSNDHQFYSYMGDLSTALIKFIDNELLAVKELDELSSEFAVNSLTGANYKLSLSVKQLGFMVYLATDCGIILEQKVRHVHQYVTSHMSTVSKEDISEKSFKNAYYLHSPEDIKKVTEKLSQMLARAQELY